MATLRAASSALFTTVEQTAGTITDILSTASTGAKMLNEIVSDARDKQQMSLKVGKVGFKEQLLHTRMVEIDQIQEKAQQYVDSDPARAARCQKILFELNEALAA